MSGILKITDLVSIGRNGVLFVCVANAARSQMAEGFARFLGPSAITIYSAGSAPTEVHPKAVAAMREVGINISEHESKSLDAIPLTNVAVAITLCEEDECPVLPDDIELLSWPMPDPLNGELPEGDETLAFRRVRDQIRELVSSLF
jgi:arsenate reductase